MLGRLSAPAHQPCPAASGCSGGTAKLCAALGPLVCLAPCHLPACQVVCTLEKNAIDSLLAQVNTSLDIVPTARHTMELARMSLHVRTHEGMVHVIAHNRKPAVWKRASGDM